MTLDIKRLEAFVAVADSGTYEEAADLLGRPQPTVWKQVDQLQQDLDGLKLVQGGRPLRLTSAGVEFLRLARETVNNNHKLERMAAGMRSGDSGVVKIAAYPAHVDRFIAEISGRFKRAYPDTRIEFAPHSEEGTAGRELIDKLRSGEVDLAVAQVRPGDKRPDRDGLTGRLACQVRLIVALPDGHQHVNKPLIVPTDIEGEPLLIPPTGYYTRLQIEDVFKKAGVPLVVGAESGQWDGLLAMSRAGAGIAIVPDDALTADEREKNIYPPLLDGDGNELVKDLWIVWRIGWENPTLIQFQKYVNEYCDRNFPLP